MDVEWPVDPKGADRAGADRKVVEENRGLAALECKQDLPKTVMGGGELRADIDRPIRTLWRRLEHLDAGELCTMRLQERLQVGLQGRRRTPVGFCRDEGRGAPFGVTLQLSGKRLVAGLRRVQKGKGEPTVADVGQRFLVGGLKWPPNESVGYHEGDDQQHQSCGP